MAFWQGIFLALAFEKRTLLLATNRRQDANERETVEKSKMTAVSSSLNPVAGEVLAGQRLDNFIRLSCASQRGDSSTETLS
jgi:hypothetical protein